MHPSAPQTLRFISAVRRRVALIRIAESIAISIAIASIAALALLPILWWRGQSAMPLVQGAVGLGLLAGVLWGVSRRPTVLSVAALVDRQLGLDDLLGTVVTVEKGAVDDLTTAGWMGAVVAIAEQRCRNLTPGHLVLRRLDARAWGGAGLLVGLLLTLGLITGQASDTRASLASRAAGGDEVNSMLDHSETSGAAGAQPARNRPAGADTTNEGPERGGNGNANAEASDSSRGSNNSSANHDGTAGNQSATGGGMAVTHADQTSHNQTPADGGGNQSALNSGIITGGAGAANSQSRGNGAEVGSSAASNNDRSTPPWKTTGWAGDVQSANDAIRAGRVPDDAADVVREYFRND